MGTKVLQCFISKQTFSGCRWKFSLACKDSEHMAIIKVTQTLTILHEIKSMENNCVDTSSGKILDTLIMPDVGRAVFFHDVSLPIVRPTNQIAQLIMELRSLIGAHCAKKITDDHVQ